MTFDNTILAFGLTLLAGLCTGIGGALAFFCNKTNTKLLSVALGFSAGIMIYVSMTELFFDAQQSLTNNLGHTLGPWITVISFFGGMFLIAVIDKLIPSSENPHESHDICELEKLPQESAYQKNLFRVGVLTAVSIIIHNFPEGMATLVSTMDNPSLGITIAGAIAIHNIPEGIAVSIPIYFATGSRRKAFIVSLFSGLAEPFGALIAFFALRPFLNGTILGVLFAAIAGIMVFVSLDELLPTARRYGEHHLSIYGLILGMVVMAVSLLTFI